MPFFDRLFGKKKPEETNNLEVIEQALNCKFPPKFHELIQSNKGKEIILDLPDEQYRILQSITNQGSIDDPYEQVVYLSKDMKTHQVLQSESRKIPFARNLSGDQFKYLFFEGEEGTVFNEKIFFTDMDSLIGQLDISKSINILASSSKKEEGQQVIIDCKPKSVQKIFNDLELPKPISYWQDSFGTSSRENTEKRPDGFSIQQHAINYEFDDPEENMVKFEMHLTFAKGDKLLFTSSAYEVDNSKLKGSISHNVEYRTFYFKFFSILDTLMKSKEAAIKQDIMSEADFFNLVDINQLCQMTKQTFKSIDTRHV